MFDSGRYQSYKLQRTVGILLALALAMTATIAAAPQAAAQTEIETITGTIRGGDVPLAGVIVSTENSDVSTGSDGGFSIQAEPVLTDVSLQGEQAAEQPQFWADGSADFALSPADIDLPQVRYVEFTVQGGFYTDCSYDAAIADGCVIDEICTVELATAGLCDEVFIEIRQSLDFQGFSGQWSSVGETVDNTVVLPVFDVPGFRIWAFTVDAGQVEFNWNGSDSMVLDLDNPYTGYTWFRDTDGDGFGNPDLPTVNHPNLPSAGYTLDNTDCDDLQAETYPGAPEILSNGIDEDCDGEDAFGNLVTGRVLAGDMPLAGIEIYSGIVLDGTSYFHDSVTNEDGTFTFDAGPDGPFEREFILRGPDDSSDVPFFDVEVLLQALTTVDDFDIVLPEIDQIEVRVNDPAMPGYLPDAGETRVRVLDNLVGPNLDRGSWATQAETVDGVATIPVFLEASGPNSKFFIVARGIDDEAVIGATPFAGDNPTFITLLAPPFTWYPDLDGDFFGDPDGETITSEVSPGPGWEQLGTDCDDTDSAINPLADEIAGNGIDEDCDGADGAPQLEIRFDIVRENGEICAPNFASATPGLGEPLQVLNGEEVTLCFKVINNGPGPLTDVTIDHPDLIQPFVIGDLVEGAEAGRAFDRLVNSDDGASAATVTALDSDDELLSASDDAAVDILSSDATIGNFVWRDLNENGVQDEGEPGVPAVTVLVASVDADGELIEVVDDPATDEFGVWTSTVPPGDYRVLFVAPPGTDSFSPKDIGDDTADSDAITTGREFGLTEVLILAAGDNNLDVDAGLIFQPSDWFIDSDGDQFGDDNTPPVTASAPPGPDYVERAGDCDDTDPAINPDASEIPGNTIDEDCDGEIVDNSAVAEVSIGDYQVDAGDTFTVEVALLPDPSQPIAGAQFDLIYNPAVVQPVLNLDPDDFFYGVPLCSIAGCGPAFPNGTVKVGWLTGGDGFDEATTILALDFIAVAPIGTTDLGIANLLVIDKFAQEHPVVGFDGTVTVIESFDWYIDVDGDGFGDAAADPVVASIAPTPDHVLDNTDCDDDNAAINPDAIEIPGNDDDEDCNGVALAQAFCFGLAVTIDLRTGVSGTSGTDQADVILGTAGRDVIVARGGDDVICSGGGDDFVNAGSGDDLVASGAGNDTVFAGAGNDDVRGGLGDDELRGQDDDDALRGGGGIDRLLGQSGDDFLSGGSEDDVLFGGDGNDLIRGGIGADDLRGSMGDDRMLAGDGDDLLYGGLGVDVMSGGAGLDQLWGGGDDDRLFGNGGTDFLYGQSGTDVLVGGDDVDTCVDPGSTSRFLGCEVITGVSPF